MGSTTSSLEMYLNHQVRTHVPNGKSSRSSTSSPPQHGLPQTVSSVDNQLKSAGLAVDLNDKGKLDSHLSASFFTCNLHNSFTQLVTRIDEKIMTQNR